MYKLIIVDDEKEVRQGMIQKIDFQALGFAIVGEAENGVDALDVIERENPDLALIDIKMPYMDGIELSEHIYNRFPALQVIILSGYDEFEFAQKAIRYNVLEYVVKPISSKELVKLLQRAKQALDDEKARKNDLLKIETEYQEALPIIKERFLNALVLEHHSIKNLRKKIIKFNIPLGDGNFIVAIVKPDEIANENEDLYAFSIFETCKEIIADDSITCFHNHEGETILIFDNRSEKPFMHVLEEIRAVVEKKHIQTVTIGLGEQVDDMDEISQSYKGALQALSYRLIEGNNKILWIRDLEPDRLDLFAYADLEGDFINLIRQCDHEGIKSTIHREFALLQEKRISVTNLKNFVMDMVVSIYKLLRQYKLDHKWFVEHRNLYETVYGIDDFKELIKLVEMLALDTSELIKATRKNNIKELIDKAVDYLNANYKDSSLSLDFVADYLHISSEYLSRQFKKEMDTTFIQYLMTLRLEAAKRLIEDSNLKNFEVADVVGYSEANYFSYAFKKFYGISPSNYRKSIKAGK